MFSSMCKSYQLSISVGIVNIQEAHIRTLSQWKYWRKRNVQWEKKLCKYQHDQSKFNRRTTINQTTFFPWHNDEWNFFSLYQTRMYFLCTVLTYVCSIRYLAFFLSANRLSIYQRRWLMESRSRLYAPKYISNCAQNIVNHSFMNQKRGTTTTTMTIK